MTEYEELFHYTSAESARRILEEGLKPTACGPHCTAADLAIIQSLGIPASTPLIYLTKSWRADQDLYGGYLLRVQVPKKDLIHVFEDVYVTAKPIPPENIDDVIEEFRMGICQPSPLCIECEQALTCPYLMEEEDLPEELKEYVEYLKELEKD